MPNIIPLLLILLHLVCCILIYVGIELHILKIKRYLMPFVLLVPVSGVLCCLILHFQLFVQKNPKALSGVEKLKNNQDVYRSIIADQQSSSKEVVPLEDALIVSDARTRRNLIMDVLNDHPENYLDALLQARLNEDVDVVHYATTSMVELSKSYDNQLRTLEQKLTQAPEDDAVLEEFCAFFKTYLAQRVVKGKIEAEHRVRYSQLLIQRLTHAQTFPALIDLAENELYLKHYDMVASILQYMQPQWQNEEPYQMLLLQYYVETMQRDKINQQIAFIDQQNIYITRENRKKLDYWRIPDYEQAEKQHKSETISV